MLQVCLTEANSNFSPKTQESQCEPSHRLQVRPSKQGRKEHHQPSHFVHALKQGGARNARGEALGGYPILGELHGGQDELAGMSGTGCSHPSGMPADGFSRRARRQRGDFAAESGILRRRQRPCCWRGALQLHNAWHAPPGLRSQRRQAWGDMGSLQPLTRFQLMASLEACVPSAGKAEK